MNFLKTKIPKRVASIRSIPFTPDYKAASIGAGKTSTSSKASSPKEPLVDMFLNPSKVEVLNDEITALRTNFTKNLRQLNLDEVQKLSVDTVTHHNVMTTSSISCTMMTITVVNVCRKSSSFGG